MGDINIKQLESLRWRMRVIETLTVIGTAWIALAVYQKKEELVYYLVGAVVLLFLLKYYTQFHRPLLHEIRDELSFSQTELRIIL